jgi:hypothetical protein
MHNATMTSTLAPANFSTLFAGIVDYTTAW